ncbi:MAG: hypothetical protein LAN70_15655 [Acidobacteriia bacterium]|nr:hypothetical protein [Terriglobia bacterium]
MSDNAYARELRYQRYDWQQREVIKAAATLLKHGVVTGSEAANLVVKLYLYSITADGSTVIVQPRGERRPHPRHWSALAELVGLPQMAKAFPRAEN